MSKIFDALRKAEMRKGAQQSNTRKDTMPARPAVKGSRRQDAFISEIDKDFRRALMNLRNAIDSEFKDRDSRVIMFTSAVKGEGKTLISSYLARILAMSGSDDILMIDCAVNEPRLHKLFGVENDKGIIDYLFGDAEIEDIIKNADGGLLDIIPAGSLRLPDITPTLFKSQRMRDLITDTGSRYDYVLIDTSAILESPETPVIGSCANGIALVVEAGQTKREVVKRAILMVEKLEGRFLGSILNRKKFYIPEFIYRRV
ncbi:MAG: CpsD/CapB family tyrosine-protein kinase [Candidatus Krumholzibacteriota bacterium]|nr:CpsD/CapB family tyrosine-protein kinase [Candidatus Krumholzibacteriota bacterium]